MEDRKIKILGTEYKLKFTNRIEEPILKEADGECRWYDKVIIIDKELNDRKCTFHVVKHEIVHAFLRESGLKSYASDELIVDWIAWHLDAIKEAIRTALYEGDDDD